MRPDYYRPLDFYWHYPHLFLALSFFSNLADHIIDIIIVMYAKLLGDAMHTLLCFPERKHPCIFNHYASILLKKNYLATFAYIKPFTNCYR